MMKKVFLFILLVILSGCSLVSQTVTDVDKHIGEMTKETSITTECVAGFYAGVAFSTDNLKIAKIVQEMDSIADKQSKDYLRCKAKRLEVSILAIASQEQLDKAVRLMGSIP